MDNWWTIVMKIIMMIFWLKTFGLKTLGHKIFGYHFTHHVAPLPSITCLFTFLMKIWKCPDCIWLCWTFERFVHGATSFVYKNLCTWFTLCFLLPFLTDGVVLLLGFESLLKSVSLTKMYFYPASDWLQPA